MLKKKNVVLGLMICLAALYWFYPAALSRGAGDVRIAAAGIKQCASTVDWSKTLTLQRPNFSWVVNPVASWGYATACLKNVGGSAAPVSYSTTPLQAGWFGLVATDGYDVSGFTLNGGASMPVVIKWITDSTPANASFIVTLE